MTEKLEFELLSLEDVVIIIKQKTNKKMMEKLCEIITSSKHTKVWDFEEINNNKALLIGILMKSANEYNGWGATDIVIQNFEALVMDDEMKKNSLKKALFRCVRMYADDHHRVPKRKNGYMEMLLQDIRKLINRK